MKNQLTVAFHLIGKLCLFILVLGFLTACESRRIIVNGLDEKEANEILVFLAGKGINATKVQAASEGGAGNRLVLWNISVDEARANEAMALLNQVGLPRRRSQNLLGIFPSGGLVPSGLEQKIRYQAGLAEQIASTIRKIDGVLDADVQVSFPEEDPLNPTAAKQPITASVYVKHSGVLDDPNAHLQTRIKRLVASSINGLDYDNVTVIGDRARFIEPTYSSGEEERSFVNVWTLTIARDSLTRFRIVFFSLVSSVLLLLLFTTWLLWKFSHVLKEAGGIKELLNYHPIKTENLAKDTIIEEAPPAEEKPPENDESDTAGKGVDET